MAKLHIGLPVYNGQDYLAQALDSLLAQTFSDFEIILSDNGSTDGTWAIAQDYARRDPRIKVLRVEENRGAAWNWNNTFAHATAPYFKWASHDDLHDPHHLERCLAVLEQEPSVVLCYTAVRFIDADGLPIEDEARKAIVGGQRSDGCHLRQPKPHQRLRGYLGRYPSHVDFGVIRRDALARTRGLGSYSAADRILVAELVLQGQFYEIDEELFIRRLHTTISWTQGMSEQEYAVWFDPKNAGRRSWPVLKRGVELVRGIAHARLAPWDALRSYAEMARFIVWNHGVRRVRRKVGAALRKVIRLSQAGQEQGSFREQA
jgi:glycosyltransferase involved in cell wall biosynthesis